MRPRIARGLVLACLPLTACGPASRPAPSPEPAEALAPAADAPAAESARPPAITGFHPRRGRRVTWPAAPGPEVTIEGEGFALPATINSVFFGGVKAQVLSGNASQLVVVPKGGPRVATLAVVASPTDRDEATALDRATAALPFTFIGPPARIEVLEGAAQTATAGSELARMAVRVLDEDGEGVPGERVFFVLRAAPGQRGSDPAGREAKTDDLGIASATLSLGSTAGSYEVRVATDTPAGASPTVRLRVTALPPTGVLDRLTAELRSGEAARRQKAAKDIGEIGPTAAAAIPALVAQGADDSADVRVASAMALGRLGAPEKGVPILVELLRRDGLHERMAAAFALARMGPAAKDAVPALAAVLETNRGGRDYGARVEALGAIVAIGGAAEAAVPALIGALDDGDAWIRQHAAAALGRIGAKAAAAAPRLRRLVKEEQRPDVRQAAEAALRFSLGGVAPTELRRVDDEERRGAAGSHLALRVEVKDVEGKGMPYERVSFRVTGGPARISQESVLTDERGVATADLVLGPTGGVATLEARHERNTVIFRVSVSPP